jgi:hypothetical protein
MATIKQTRTKTTYRKSRVKPKHCPTCGAFISRRGNRSAKTRVYKWWDETNQVKNTFHAISRKNHWI